MNCRAAARLPRLLSAVVVFVVVSGPPDLRTHPGAYIKTPLYSLYKYILLLVTNKGPEVR